RPSAARDAALARDDPARRSDRHALRAGPRPPRDRPPSVTRRGRAAAAPRSGGEALRAARVPGRARVDARGARERPGDDRVTPADVGWLACTACRGPLAFHGSLAGDAIGEGRLACGKCDRTWPVR